MITFCGARLQGRNNVLLLAFPPEDVDHDNREVVLLLGVLIILATRVLLVILFLPFSALDKILNFNAAVGQAKKAVPNEFVAQVLIFAGLTVEALMSCAVLSGVLDRLAAFILAGYCVVTAILWKKFWREPDFTLKGKSQGRDIFWDFLKNLAVAGGFLTLAFGTSAAGVADFISHPFSSTHPYSIGAR